MLCGESPGWAGRRVGASVESLTAACSSKLSLCASPDLDCRAPHLHIGPMLLPSRTSLDCFDLLHLDSILLWILCELNHLHTLCVGTVMPSFMFRTGKMRYKYTSSIEDRSDRKGNGEGEGENSKQEQGCVAVATSIASRNAWSCLRTELELRAHPNSSRVLLTWLLV